MINCKHHVLEICCLTALAAAIASMVVLNQLHDRALGDGSPAISSCSQCQSLRAVAYSSSASYALNQFYYELMVNVVSNGVATKESRQIVQWVGHMSDDEAFAIGLESEEIELVRRWGVVAASTLNESIRNIKNSE